MTPTVHQLVHGYSKGHSLLASSCKLPRPALDVIVEQSDLSGPLPAGVSIPSHLTAYPVPDTQYYALARTWPDMDAPRSGCVMTHTLLIPKNVWGTVTTPAAYLRLHKRPERQSLDSFRHEIKGPKDSYENAHRPSLTPAEAYEFSDKVFRAGLQSVVWFECEEPEQLVLSFASLLWPSLRNSFYAHTFSLHAHAKVKNNLQLHFAPRNARSYFSRVSKQCRMGNLPAVNSKESEQQWIIEISEYLLAGRPTDSYVDGLNSYGHLLGSEPPAVRNLFALRDLAGRLSNTPIASIGILDIIDSLEPLAERAVKEKKHALNTAVSAALKSDVPSALHCLSLVDARLRRPSFSIAANETTSIVKDAVQQIVANNPQTFFATCGESNPLDASSFWEGVIDGIRVAAEDHPNMIEGLAECPSVASFVVGGAPTVASAYLHSNPNRRAELISEIVKWIRRVDRDDQRLGLCQELLSDIRDVASAPLLEELLKDVRDQDVSNILDTLVESTQGFARASLRRIISNFICQHFPEETIEWGRHSRLLQNNFVPEVIAEAFTLSLEGLDHVLGVDWVSADDRCDVWSAFVVRAANKQLPQWFVRRAAEDAAIMDPFAECYSWSARTMNALKNISDQCDYLPLVRSRCLTEFVQRIADTDLCGWFVPLLVDSAINEHIRGTVDADQMLLALKLGPCERYFEQVPVGRIHRLLLSSPDESSWQRAWETLSILPRPLFQRVASHQIISGFTQSFRACWTASVADAWSCIVSRSQEELPLEAALRLSMQSTAFCLNNPRLPVAQIVCLAFPPVYEAVSTGRANHITDEMFSYFDWDKAKKLRKDIINAYLASNWPAEELAVIGSRCHVLRKLIHRLQRKWGGDEYIRKMAAGLASQRSVEASSVRANLSEILNDPDFFEPWD